MSEKNLEAKQHRKYLLKLFAKGSKQYWPIMALSSVSIIISLTLGDIIFTYLVSKILVDLSTDQVASFDSYRGYIYTIIAIEIVSLLLRRVASFSEERFDAKSRVAISKIIFDRLLEHSASFHQNRFVGTTVTLISKTADAFGRTSAIWIYSILPMLVVFIGTGVLMLPRLPLYFICLVLTGTLFLVLVLKLLPTQMKLATDASREVTRMYGAMSDAISNIAAVKAESGEVLEQEKISEIGELILEKNLRYANRALIRDSLIANSVNRSLRTLAVIVAIVVANGSNQDISNLYLATTLTMTFLTNIWTFGDSLSELTLYYGDAAPIVPMLEAEISIKDKKDADELVKARGKIEIERVSFKYPKLDTYVFDDLNLTINAGERVGIVGRSGAGKSTLVKMIMRFIDPTKGDIKLDGISTRSITQESLRNNISYVAQEPMLFHRSVVQNITYGSENVTDEEIQHVLERSHALEFINELPKGLDSIVGERGVNLSGGQRQRIVIARAMLKNAPILILDEATSALDSESEGYVQAAFAELMKGRTTLVIAHRLSTLLNMSRIIVFEHGQMIEDGTHAQLVKARGIYAGLWEHQAGGFLPQS